MRACTDFLGSAVLATRGSTSTCAGATGRAGCANFCFSLPLVLVGGLALGFSSSPYQLTGGWQGRPYVGRHLCFCRGAGRTFLSRLGAKPARAASGPMGRSGDRVSFVRPVAFQQTISTLQLALCSAGHDRGNLLRPGMAREPPRTCVDDHAYVRGLAVVVVVLELSPRTKIYPPQGLGDLLPEYGIGPEK